MHRAKKIRIHDIEEFEKEIVEIKLDEDGSFSESKIRNSIARHIENYLSIPRRHFCCDYSINRECLIAAFTNAARSKKDASRAYKFIHTLISRQIVEPNIYPPMHTSAKNLNEYVSILFFVIGMVPAEDQQKILSSLSQFFASEDPMFSKLRDYDPDTNSDFVDLIDYILLKCQFE